MKSHYSSHMAPASLPKQVNWWSASVVCFSAGLYYLYEFILQVSPSIVTTELMRDLQTDSEGVGIISGIYYVTYTIMQIPAGLLYDRFGPHLILFFASLLCALGVYVFGTAEGVIVASIGRLLMGFASAFAFTGCLVLIHLWFPLRYFEILAGVIHLLSSVAVLITESSLVAIIEAFGWRNVIFSLSVMGIIIAILIALFVRNPSVAKTKQASEILILLSVIQNKQSWWVAFYSFTLWAPMLVFAALWGGPYLMTRFNIDLSVAMTMIAAIWVMAGLGGPLAGWIANKIRSKRKVLFCCSFIGFMAIVSILYIDILPLWTMYPLFLLLGVSGAGLPLTFAITKENNKANCGTAMGFNNMAVVVSGLLFQPLVGFFLKIGWDGSTKNGIPIYLIDDFTKALSIIPLCFFTGMLISLFRIKIKSDDTEELLDDRVSFNIV
jgi:MFS family permease